MEDTQHTVKKGNEKEERIAQNTKTTRKKREVKNGTETNSQGKTN